MAFDLTLTDDILSAVRAGDIKLLEQCFSHLSNPDEYLNRVYDEDMQKCTLLTIACLNGHENVISMILNNYKPDLEIQNNILFGDENRKSQLCTNVTVLWVAAAVNNFQMVKVLVEHGANVNHTTKTNSTPLRSACYNGNLEIARYLIDHGADVHITKENNDTNLAVSVYRQHLPMVTYLVDELGCDVNVFDSDGRSPLYDAVNCGSLELVEFLLNRGARNFRAICDQMSPLMWAAEKRRIDLMKSISLHCSLIEQIEAEELLGSAFACTDLEDRDFERSFEHLSQALELRSIHHLPKELSTTTNDLFDYRQECQTIEQLKEYQSNHSSLCIEGLLVRERLLGPNNSEYRYSLRYHGAILADNAQHDQAIAFWMYELRLRQKYSIEIDPENLRHFASMFSEMTFLSLPIPVNTLLIIMKVIAEMLGKNRTDFDYNFYTLLFLITITSQYFTKMNNISFEDRKEVYGFLYSFNKQKYVTQADGSSLLHLSVDKNSCADDHFIDRTCTYPCLLTVRMLIQCGADVNATNTIRNTPLHVLVANQSGDDENILNILFDYDTHLDSVNILRQSAIDLALRLNTIQLLKSKMKLSLKCLCAQLIQTHNIPCHGKLSKSLIKFVKQH